MRGCIARILLERAIELFLGKGQVALAQMLHREIEVDLRGALHVCLLLTRVAGAASQANREGHEPDDGCYSSHDCTATEMSLEPSRTVVRSFTLPTSWPHAASMSSPRVRRVVATTPFAFKISRKRSIASGVERR